MPSQRITLGIGLAILVTIGAASIGLDLKSRSDTAAVDHALAVLGKISDMRPLLRRAESAARGFALTGDPERAKEYREASDTILPALDSLIETVKTNLTERRLIEETKTLVERQIAANGELIRLRTAGDSAAIAALVSQEDRPATAAIASNLQKTVAEERRVLAARRAESETTGRFLLAVNLAGIALILILATALTLSIRRSRQELRLH